MSGRASAVREATPAPAPRAEEGEARMSLLSEALAPGLQLTAAAQSVSDGASARASSVVAAAQERDAARAATSAVEEERARTRAKQAHAEAGKQAAATQAARHVTIDALRADLAQARAAERAELGEQHDRSRADLHRRFEGQRAQLRAQAAGDRSRLEARLDAEQATLREDITGHTEALEAHAATRGHELAELAAAEEQRLVEAAERDAGELGQIAATEGAATAAAAGRATARIDRAADEGARQAAATGTREELRARTDGLGQGKIVEGELHAQMARAATAETTRRLAEARADGAAAVKQRSTVDTRESTVPELRIGIPRPELRPTASDLRVPLDELGAQGQATVEAAGGKLAGALARLDAEEAAADGQLDAELARRLADVEKRAADTGKQLDAGKEHDLRRLARLVEQTTAAIDHASAEAARNIDAAGTRAEQRSKAEVERQLRAIAADAQAAMTALEAEAAAARAHVRAEAEASDLQLELDANQALGEMEKEARRQAIALEAQTRKEEARLAAAGARQRAAIEARAAAAEQQIDGLRAGLDTDLAGMKELDLTAARNAAEALDDAMDRIGTDEDGVFRALGAARSPAEMRAIKAAYQLRTGRELDADLDRELSDDDLRKARALESGDPTRIAVEKLAGAEGGLVARADAATIVATLAALPDGPAKAKVAREFQRTTGKRLATFLAEQVDGEDLEKARRALADMPPLDDRLAVDPARLEQVDRRAMGEAAAELRRAMDRRGTDEDAIHRALRGRSPEELETLQEIYRSHYHVELIDQLESELSGTDLQEATAALSGDPVDAAVASLENAMDGAGTDEARIHAVLEGEADPDVRRRIMGEFERRTGRSLAAAIEGEMRGTDREIALTLLRPDDEERRGEVGAIRLDVASDRAGTDEHAIFEVLEQAGSPAERKAIADAYARRAHRTVAAMLEAEMRGTDLDLGQALARGDRAGAAAARIEAATSGLLGADKEGIYAQLEGHGEEERRALVAAYQARYHRDLDGRLAGSLSGLEREKAEHLLRDGRVPAELALELAMAGAGTDEAAIKRLLAGKRRDELDVIRSTYRLRFHKDLDAEIHRELSGRDDFQVGLMLEGEPADAAGKLERSRKLYAYERGGGGGSTRVGRALTDVFSDSGADLDRSHAELAALEEELVARGAMREGPGGRLEMVPGAALDAGTERKLAEATGWHGLDVESYQQAKDAVTDHAAMAATVVVGGALSTVTLGATSPALIAALASLGGSASGMAVKALMQGGAYGLEDVGVDAGRAVFDAATAGLGRSQAWLRRAGKMAGALSGAEQAAARRVLTQAIAAGGTSALGGMAAAGFEGALAGRDAGDLLAGIVAGGAASGLEGLLGGLLGSVQGTPGTGLVGEALGERAKLPGIALGGALAGATGSLLPALASGVWKDGVYDGRIEDLLGRFTTTAATGAVQGAFAATGDARRERAAARRAEAEHGSTLRASSRGRDGDDAFSDDEVTQDLPSPDELAQDRRAPRVGPPLGKQGRDEHLARLAAESDPLERLELWRDVHKHHAERSARKSSERTRADTSLTPEERDRRVAATAKILASTLEEIAHEVAHLRKGWGSRDDATNLRLVDDVIARKQLEHDLEMRHNVNITNEEETPGSTDPLRAPTTRATWSIDDLHTIGRSLESLPAEHVLGNRLLPPSRNHDGSVDKRLPGLELARAGVNLRYEDGAWLPDSKVAADHQPNGRIRVFNSGVTQVRARHGVEPLREFLVHEIGHDVERAHGAFGKSAAHATEGSPSSFFRRAAGWDPKPRSLEDLMGELTALGPVGHALPEFLADREVTNLEMQGSRHDTGATSRAATGDRVYQTDIYDSNAFRKRTRGALPEEHEDPQDPWAYSRTHPAETFAEQYTAAVNAPRAYHGAMIAGRRALVLQLEELLAAVQGELATAGDDRQAHERASARFAALRSNLDGARAEQRARKDQFDIMRNWIFGSEGPAIIAEESLRALPAPPGGEAEREARIARFVSEAAAAVTPAQIEQLRLEAEADLL